MTTHIDQHTTFIKVTEDSVPDKANSKGGIWSNKISSTIFCLLNLQCGYDSGYC
jgi:hypothetical protein